MMVELDRRAIRFPRTGHIWIPLRGRRIAAAGIAMHSPCRPTRVLAQRALYLAVRLLGPRVIPGERSGWEDPLPDPEWADVLAAWRRSCGHFDNLVLYRRPQVGRTGFAALLLQRGRGIGFARFHPDAGRIEREFTIIQGVHDSVPASFRVARPIATGRVASGGAWLLSASLPNYPLGSVRKPAVRERVADEIGEVLSAVIPRPQTVPADWLPAHGDLAPWNLRTLLSGAVRVIDWEDAGYAPPGLDRLYGALTAHSTFGSPLPASAPAGALQWLSNRLRHRASEASDGADLALLASLSTVAPQ